MLASALNAREQLLDLESVVAHGEAIRDRAISDLQSLAWDASCAGVTFTDFQKLLEDIRGFQEDLADDILGPAKRRLSELNERIGRAE